jgi:hypothetical protein
MPTLQGTDCVEDQAERHVYAARSVGRDRLERRNGRAFRDLLGAAPTATRDRNDPDDTNA